MPKDIIEITQYGVARIQKDNTHIKGLCTKNLNVCLGLILISQKHLLLMHIDTNVDTDYVAKQIAWIDKPYSMAIAMNEQQLQQVTSLGLMPAEFSVQGFLKRLKDSLIKLSIAQWDKNLRFCNASAAEVTVLTSGEIKIFPSGTEKVPDFNLRQSIDFLNYVSKYDNSASMYAKLDLDVQYDINHWTIMPSLSPIAEKLIQTYQLSTEWSQFITKLRLQPLVPTNLVMFLQAQRAGIEKQIIECINLKELTASKNIAFNKKAEDIKIAPLFGKLKKGFFNQQKQPSDTKTEARKQEIFPLDADGEPTTKFEFYC